MHDLVVEATRRFFVIVVHDRMVEAARHAIFLGWDTALPPGFSPHIVWDVFLTRWDQLAPNIVTY